MIELLRPCSTIYPDGKQFGEWGPMWGYHFDEAGRWVKGQAQHLGKLVGQHGGVDIKCPEGVTLAAPAAGRILEAGWQDPKDPKRGYGKRVMIETDPVIYDGKPYSLILTLGHFSEIWAMAGARVLRGGNLGLSGSTGNTDGPHVHVQLEKPGAFPRMPLNFKWVTV